MSTLDEFRDGERHHINDTKNESLSEVLNTLDYATDTIGHHVCCLGIEIPMRLNQPGR